MKILLAVPTYETIYPDTFKSIWDLERGGNEVIFEFIRGYDVATARNKIAQRALDLKADYLFMVDNDVILPPDALIKLLEDPKDVCLGFYKHRNKVDKQDDITCVCKMGEQNFFNQYTGKELSDLRKNGQYKLQIHGGGMGCALIKTSVFERIKFPYFDWVNYESKKLLSEDLYFCVQCGKANIPIYCDTRVRCGHIMRYAQYPTQ